MPVPFSRPVTLIGGGPVDPAALAQALALAPELVAADRGADRAAALGHRPALVIGDMDSIADPGCWRVRGTPMLHLAEQDTTDFEKCLYATEAPHYIGLGFVGGRVDHMLAVFHALLRRPGRTVVLVGEADVMALVPPGRPLSVAVPEGARVSLFPLLETRGTHSVGLLWPVQDLTLAPGRQIGTSNRASGGRITVGFDRPGALLLLERDRLGPLLSALTEPE